MNLMVKTAYDALEDKKGINIKVIDISGISDVADYFVIASGSNINQVQALADNVSFEMKKNGYEEKSIEGFRNGEWILQDYGDVVVHVFNNNERSFYNLERIWQDGKLIDMN